METSKYQEIADQHQEELTRIQQLSEAVEQVKTLHSLSTSEKLRTLHVWKENPWFGWAIITLLSCQRQAESFSKQPPVGIEGMSQREQALGEVNGLSRFGFEVDSILANLVEDLSQESKPKTEIDNKDEN